MEFTLSGENLSFGKVRGRQRELPGATAEDGGDVREGCFTRVMRRVTRHMPLEGPRDPVAGV